MIVDGCVPVGIGEIGLVVLLIHQLRVVLQRVSGGASAGIRVVVEVVQPVDVQRFGLSQIVHHAVAVEQRGGVGTDAALLVVVDGIVEVVAVLRHVLHDVIDFLLEVGDASSVVEGHQDDGKEQNGHEDAPEGSGSADWKWNKLELISMDEKAVKVMLASKII